MVPGTERIWINGEQLERGYGDDYTIDYATGEITFTENRIIGSDMRIVADYEYASESYRRNFYSAGGDASFFGDRLDLGIRFAREADDDNRPVLMELDSDLRSALSNAGDSTAVTTGIRPAAEDSTGSYDLVNGVLVHNPRMEGDYNVTFSWVGEDRGSYRYRGGGIYEFVPPESRTPGSGASYEPVTVTPAPTAHTVAGATLSFSPIPSLKVEGEAAGSTFDRNTLSGRDDADNGGGAYRLETAFDPVVGRRVPVRLTFRGAHRTRERTFIPLDRDRSPEENREWGLPLVREPGGEEFTEYAAGAALEKGFFAGSGVDFEGGRAGLEHGGRSVRNRTGAQLHIGGHGSGDMAWRRILRRSVPGLPDEDIDRLDASARVDLPAVTPVFEYEGERAEGRGGSSHGSAFSEFRSGVETRPLFGVTGRAEWLYRTESALKSSWRDSSLVRGGSVGIEAPLGAHGSIRSRYARRERIGGGSRGTTDQALLEGSFRPGGGPSGMDVTYRAGRSRETTKRRNYIYTGGDRGAFRWEDANGDGVRDPDEFIPDEHGSYYLYEETLDDYRPVNGVGLFSRLRFILPCMPARMEGVETETTVEINEKSSAPASDVFLLNLARFRKRGLTSSGDARVQEDVTAPLPGGGSVRLRVFRFASYEGSFVTGGERRREDGESFRVRTSPRENWDLEMTLARSLASRGMENRPSGDFRVRSWSLEGESTWFPAPLIGLGMGFAGGYDRDGVSGIDARYVMSEPTVTWHFSGRGRVVASWTVNTVTTGGGAGGKTIPYTMARGDKAGTNHHIGISCDYRLSHRMNIIATYTGRRFADRDFEHFARTQLRAIF